MAEHRVSPARKHRRHPASLSGEGGTAHGVDAPLNPMKAPDGHAMLDRAPTQPHRLELPKRDDPMLAVGESGDPAILLTFRTYVVPFVRSIGHPATIPGRLQRVGKRTATSLPRTSATIEPSHQ